MIIIDFIQWYRANIENMSQKYYIYQTYQKKQKSIKSWNVKETKLLNELIK